MVSKERGFTVVEILIGIGLFAIVMPSIIIAVVTVAGLNDRAADLTRANIVAEEKLESLRSAGYNTLNDGTIDFSVELDPSFTKPRTASYTISSPRPGLRQIEVNISYTDREVTRQLNYTSLMSELGVAQ